ncbi:MAG: hypothetical protein LBS57_04110 [Treponema sp.]|jgi:hypothetical protein|nr:hypothetical protein [Treponema sp.]
MNTVPNKNLQAGNRAPESSGSPVSGGDLFSELKDRAVFMGWIAGLVIAGALIWSLTQPLQVRSLMRSVNRTLALRGDSRRALAPYASRADGPLGVWYSLVNSDSRLFVFAVMRDGVLVPCGAEVSGEGVVGEIIPLSAHAVQVLSGLPRGVLKTYIRRIENAAAGGKE